jgi:hypothetical protein
MKMKPFTTEFDDLIDDFIEKGGVLVTFGAGCAVSHRDIAWNN